MRRFAKFVAVAGFVCGSSAHAATFTQVARVQGSGEPDYTLAYLDFAGFDASLGTLNSITVTGSNSVQETLTYQYNVASMSVVPVTIQFDLGSDPGRVYLTQNTIAYVDGTGTVLKTSGHATLVDPLPNSFLTNVSGGFVLTIGAVVKYGKFGPEFVNGTVDASANAVYDYTPIGVPEPSSIAIFGALLAVPLLSRRKTL